MRGSESSQCSDLIQGKCLVSRRLLSVLFDSRATYSFISLKGKDHLGLLVSSLTYDLTVSTPTDNSLNTLFVCLKCHIVIENKHFLVDLIYLPMKHIYIILGMEAKDKPFNSLSNLD